MARALQDILVSRPFGGKSLLQKLVSSRLFHLANLATDPVHLTGFWRPVSTMIPHAWQPKWTVVEPESGVTSCAKSSNNSCATRERRKQSSVATLVSL